MFSRLSLNLELTGRLHASKLLSSASVPSAAGSLGSPRAGGIVRATLLGVAAGLRFFLMKFLSADSGSASSCFLQIPYSRLRPSTNVLSAFFFPSALNNSSIAALSIASVSVCAVITPMDSSNSCWFLASARLKWTTLASSRNAMLSISSSRVLHVHRSGC